MEKNTIALSIGGLSLGFRFANRNLINRLTSRYAGYCRQTDRCDCSFHCSFSKNKLAPHEQVKYSSVAGAWRHARRYDFDVRWKADRGEMILWPSVYSFDASLRVILANLMTEKNGLLLHASAVVRDNSAYIFLGPSGSGKTTIARLSGAEKILSDEIVAVRTAHRKAVRVFGTPFWGEMGKGPAFSKSYALHSMFFLKKHRTLYARRIRPDGAVQALLRCVCLYGKEPTDLQKSLDTCLQIVSMVDCEELYFPKRPLDWEKLSDENLPHP
jgi:hypothetical protein